MTSTAAETRLTRTLLTISLALVFSFAVALAAKERSLEWVIVALLTGLLLLASRSAVTWLAAKQKSVGLFLTIAVLASLLIVPEQVLRLSGFRYESGIRLIPEFVYPAGGYFFSKLVPDEKLLWRRVAGEADVNSWGFRGHEVQVPKPKGTYRILFLGDSCTEQGYPYMVEERLNQQFKDSDLRFESIVLATSGFSSYQGKVTAELYGAKVDPDLVVVFFGWNDHWLARGSVDAEKIVSVHNGPIDDLIMWTYGRLRVLQFANWALTGRFSAARSGHGQQRVPANQYRENLIEINRILQSRNRPIVFITAPTAYYKLGVPEYITKKGFASDAMSAKSLHKNYNKIVREVAGKEGAYLLDLEPQIGSSPDLRSIFTEDNIHFTQAGLSVVADALVDLIKTQILAAK